MLSDTRYLAAPAAPTGGQRLSPRHQLSRLSGPLGEMATSLGFEGHMNGPRRCRDGGPSATLVLISAGVSLLLKARRTRHVVVRRTSETSRRAESRALQRDRCVSQMCSISRLRSVLLGPGRFGRMRRSPSRRWSSSRPCGQAIRRSGRRAHRGGERSPCRSGDWPRSGD